MSAEDFKKENIPKKAPQGRKVDLENAPTLEKPSKRQAGINIVIEALEKKKTAATPILKKMRQAQSNAQFKETSAYLLFLLTTGISIAYYVSFKTYHSALAKMESLKKLLANPSARVAHGDTGKSILKRLRADQQKAEVPALLTQSNKSNETVDLLKQLIEARQTEKECNAPLLAAPEAPKCPESTDQRINSLE